MDMGVIDNTVVIYGKSHSALWAKIAFVNRCVTPSLFLSISIYPTDMQNYANALSMYG